MILHSLQKLHGLTFFSRRLVVADCDAFNGSDKEVTGEMGISAASDARRMSIVGCLLAASSSRFRLSMHIKCGENSEYLDCCAGVMG